MARGGSGRGSRLVGAGLTALSLGVLATGAILFTRDRSAPVEQEREHVAQRDPDLVAYGRRIAVPAIAVATARDFIRTAVLRKDLERAWQLSAAPLKVGLTKARWLAGTIPVVPYPAHAFGRASFRVVRARQRDLLLLVQIEPKKGANAPAGDFFLELVPGDHGWLVSYWGPRGHTGPMPAIP